MQNRRLERTGLAKPGKTRGSLGMGPGLAPQEAEGRVFGRFWNRTELFGWSKPGPLAGYPDPLLTLGTSDVSLLEGATNFLYIFNMSATMARQRGQVRLKQSDMHHALNMAKMCKAGFSRASV